MNENITKKYNKDAAKEQNHTDTVTNNKTLSTAGTPLWLRKNTETLNHFWGEKKKKTQKKEIKNHTLGKKKQQPKNPYVIIIWDQE